MKGPAKQFFSFRKVEMTDHSDLYEIVTPEGERVASASKSSQKLEEMCYDLNELMSGMAEEDSDIAINCC